MSEGADRHRYHTRTNESAHPEVQQEVKFFHSLGRQQPQPTRRRQHQQGDQQNQQEQPTRSASLPDLCLPQLFGDVINESTQTDVITTADASTQLNGQQPTDSTPRDVINNVDVTLQPTSVSSANLDRSTQPLIGQPATSPNVIVDTAPTSSVSSTSCANSAISGSSVSTNTSSYSGESGVISNTTGLDSIAGAQLDIQQSVNQRATLSATAHSDQNSGQISDQKSDQISTMAITQESMKELFASERKKHSSVEPTRFSGKPSDNASTWLDKFEIYLKLQNLSKEDQCLTFGLLMCGAAAMWFKNLAEDVKTDFEKLKTAFKTAYVNDKWVNRQQLENTKRCEFKSTEDYINGMIVLGGSVGVSDEDMISHLIRGLPDQTRAHVVGHNSQTLQQCISHIRICDTLAKITGTPKADIKAVMAIDTELSDMKATMAKITEKLDHLSVNCSHRGGRGGHSRGSYHNSTKRPVECYCCGKLGHYSSDCWYNYKNSQSQNNFRGRGRGGHWRGRGGGSTSSKSSANEDTSSKN